MTDGEDSLRKGLRTMEHRETSQQPGSSRQKKAAVISDMTGFGRCALTVTLPVISPQPFIGAVLPRSHGDPVQSHRISQLLF